MFYSLHQLLIEKVKFFFKVKFSYSQCFQIVLPNKLNYLCIVFPQAPYFLRTGLQTPSSRSHSGLDMSTAASTQSSTRAPTRSSRKLSKVYWELIASEWSQGHSTIIWKQFKVKLRVTSRRPTWPWTAKGARAASVLPRLWPCHDRRPPGTAESGRFFPERQQENRDQAGRAGPRWPNSAVKAFITPAVASSGAGLPRRSPAALSPLLSETFQLLKSTNCPCRKTESLCNHPNCSSAGRDFLLPAGRLDFILFYRQRMHCFGIWNAKKTILLLSLSWGY